MDHSIFKKHFNGIFKNIKSKNQNWISFQVWASVCTNEHFGRQTGELETSPLGPWLQHFIVFVSYKWAQSAGVLHYSGLDRLAKYKHSILLGPLESYKENKVLWKWHLSCWRKLTGDKVKKLFSSSLMPRTNKLEYL